MKKEKRNKADPGNFYICDPKKNTYCSGKIDQTCGNYCFLTTNPKFSSDPERALSRKEAEIIVRLRRKKDI